MSTHSDRQGDPDVLVVQSGVAASGAYVVEFSVRDRAWVRTPVEATRHALAVIRQAEVAAHDAAVIRQLTTIGTSVEHAALTVASDLRPDRLSPEPADLAPVWLEPGVAADNEPARPFLVLSLDGQRLGQWTVADAHQHALAVLQVITVADLDAAYKRALVGTIGLEPWLAANVVGDLGNHRADEPR